MKVGIEYEQDNFFIGPIVIFFCPPGPSPVVRNPIPIDDPTVG
jgi:hypothetical protein